MPPFAPAPLAAAILFVLLPLAAPAQVAPPAAGPPAAPADSAPRLSQYGVRFGPSFTTLSAVEPFDPNAVARAFEPTMNFGGFATIALAGPIALQPEILFAARGHRTHRRGAPPVIKGTETQPPAADKVILLRYLEVPLLLRLSRRTNDTTSLYAIGGPAFAFRRNAVIREVADPGRLVEIDEMVGGTNLSYVFGAGLQHKRWLVDARMTTGIRNVATTEAGAGDVTTSAFSVLMGVRF